MSKILSASKQELVGKTRMKPPLMKLRLGELYGENSDIPEWVIELCTNIDRNYELLDQYGKLNDKLKKAFGN